MIVPWAPGGTTDILGRVIAQKMGEKWGQPVIVENRGGAAGNIGGEAAAKSAPDGYTLLLGTMSSHAMNQFLYEKMSFDPVADLAPVSLVANVATVLVVHPSLPVNNVNELIALARAKPGQLNFASGGIASFNQLCAELLKMSTKIDIVHVPYKGGGPMVTDLLGGTVQMVIADQANLMPHVKAGKLRAIAVASPKRSPNLPDLPTIGESLPGFQAVAWNGLVGPPGLPPDIVAKLNAAFVKVMAMSEVRDKLAGGGLDIVGDAPEEFARFIRTEIAKWSAIAKQVGAKAE